MKEPSRYATKRYAALAAVGLALTLEVPITVSAPITAVGGVTLRQTGVANRFRDAYDVLLVLGTARPNPIENPGVGDATTVVASSNGRDLPLTYLNSPALPFLHQGFLPWDEATASGLTGDWTITAKNTAGTVGSLSAIASGIGNQSAIDPVDSIRLSGSIESGMTLNWENPVGSDSTLIVISELDPDTNARTIVHSTTLASPVDSFVVPNVLLADGPEGPISLTAGQQYVLDVISSDNDDASGRPLARAEKRFEFSATQEAIDAFLPTVDAEGDYNFDIAVEPGEQYAIDPYFAVGYDYWIGDLGDPLFASVLLPPVGDDLFELLFYNVAGDIIGMIDGFSANTLFDFTSLEGFERGVPGFGVRGIEPSARLDPADTTAFVTTLSFSSAGRFTGSMTPVTQPVPSSGTGALLTLGLLSLLMLSGRQRR